MGYHSDVAFAMTFNLHEIFLNEIKNIEDNELQENVIDLLNNNLNKEFDNESKIVFYSVSWIKWYENDDPAVDWVMDFLRNQNKDEFVFCRSGEEYEDIENFGQLWDERTKNPALTIHISILNNNGKDLVSNL